MKYRLAFILILAGAAIATETKPGPDPQARQAVQTQIVARLHRSVPPFSRVMPPMPEARYHDLILADGEKRLPFEVLEPRRIRTLPGTAPAGRAVMVSGYVRLSDQAIFVFDTKTRKHIPAAKDPRFAPPADKAKADKPT